MAPERMGRAFAIISIGLVVATGCSPSRNKLEVARGHALFVKRCAGCHTLAGRELGSSGGDLLRAHLTTADLISFARVMPSRTPISTGEAKAIATFIAARSRAHGS